VATTERASAAAERLADTTVDSYKVIVEHGISLQERNIGFLRGILEEMAGELRSQAESNRAVTRELVERAEHGRDALECLARESVDAYMELAYAPFSYYREGLRLVEREADGGEFPIAGYDELNVGEISSKLGDLSAAQIRELREYEKRGKNRETLIEQFDRKLKAVSA
jgi:hypothetical protein